MERYLIIIDKEKEYAHALAAYFNGDSAFSYRAVAVVSPEEAKDYIESGVTEVILSSEAFEKEVLCMAGQRELRVYWLSDKKQDRRESVIYRYQSAKRIGSRLEQVVVNNGEIPVISVFFPIGNFWTEQLCECMAEKLAETRRVLLLSFLPFHRERGEENGMSELLYYVRQGQESLAQYLQKQRNFEGNLTRIGAARWSIDLSRITPEDMELLLQGGKEAKQFDLLLLEIGYYDAAGLAAMRACDLLFVPVWETEDGQAYHAELIRQMREGGENKLLRCMREITLRHMEDEADVFATAREAARVAVDYIEREKQSAAGLTGEP